MTDFAGSLLVRSGLITAAQYATAMRAISPDGGTTLSEYLLISLAVGEEQLVRFYHERLLVPRIDKADLARVKPNALARIPVDMAVEFRIMPVEIDREGNLILAMADPSDTHAADEIGFFTGAYIVRAVAAPSTIAWGLHHYYGVVTPLFQPAQATSTPVEVAPAASGPVPVTPAAPMPVAPVALAPIVLARKDIKAAMPPSAGTSASAAPIVLGAVDLKPTAAPAAAALPASRAGMPSDAASRQAPATPGASPLESTPSGYPSDRPRLRRLPPAQIVDDMYGDDTPLPKPVPFDVTGSVGKIDLETGTAPQVPPRESTAPPQPQYAAQPTAPPQPQYAPQPAAPPQPQYAAQPTAPPQPPYAAQPAAPPVAVTPAATPPVTIAPAAAPPQPFHASQPATPPVTITPAADASVSTQALEIALQALAAASGRDDVARALVTYLSALYRRAVFFVVRKGALTGWLGTGVGIHENQLRETELSLSIPSLFQDIIGARVSFWGPIVDPPSRDFIIEALGWAPDDMLAIPIPVRAKVVAVLYGDDRCHEAPEDDLAVLTRAAGEALERALAVKKTT